VHVTVAVKYPDWVKEPPVATCGYMPPTSSQVYLPRSAFAASSASFPATIAECCAEPIRAASSAALCTWPVRLAHSPT